ncbi:tRNA uridine-5-carboxymethylaminomethyl(34) synthesis GTPase MnmE [Aestuariivirga sp.]|uniref:tRNA uridine-5-carboxymethylaminomethyl(34) synthesis GTPase MnmE n=1 Tax=Aestuariivirga sp. TaxID=2650926 RepID=UPI00391A71D6
MATSDTIFALSSGAGRSALAVVRLSGPRCGDVLRDLAGGVPEPRRFAVRQLRDPHTSELLDMAVVVWLPGPQSFTGEDCAEFHLHGSGAVVAAMLEVLASRDGLRPAEPGEFTRRAFLNGKMDLVEIEGLADLLEARTARQRRQAFQQMSGEASAMFESWRGRLLSIRANIEAALDFSDEAGVSEAAHAVIDQDIAELLQEVKSMLDKSGSTEIVRQGARVVLAGLPNTGKSSLLNAIAGREAAIVSEHPGTTRDSIEVMLDLRGMPVILTDTAGLRSDVVDPVEAEGIRRSRVRMSQADVVVWVWSSDVEGSELVDGSPAPDFVVQSKCDVSLSAPRSFPQNQRVSARTGEGIEKFLDSLTSLVKERFGSVESALLVSARQKSAARLSIRFLNEALGCGRDNLELKAEEIRRATDEIGRLTGRVDVEEWLGAIFNRFCIGK